MADLRNQLQPLEANAGNQSGGWVPGAFPFASQPPKPIGLLRADASHGDMVHCRLSYGVADFGLACVEMFEDATNILSKLQLKATCNDDRPLLGVRGQS